MTAKKKGSSASNEALENPEVLAQQLSKSEEWLKKNRNLAIGLGVLIVLVIGALFAYNYYTESQNSKAQEEMWQGVFYFEQDSLNKALEDDLYPGLQTIANDYGGTKAGKLASFYTGATLMQQGNYSQAIDYFKDFSANDMLVQARAYSLVGDCHMELGEYNDAASWYGKAAGYKTNEQFTPLYLLKQALAFEKLNDLEKALNCYETIVKEYPQSSQYQDARKNKARLDVIAAR